MYEPLMYVVLVGLLLIVFASFVPKSTERSTKNPSGDMLKEMEETMDVFLAELEEDNKKLIDTISVMKQEHKVTTQKLSERLDEVEKQLVEHKKDWQRMAEQVISRQNEELAARKVEALQPVQPIVEPVAPEPEPVIEEVNPSIKSRYPDLFQLYMEGKSVEYIAKKMGMNKGEVSLIIQLAEQEA